MLLSWFCPITAHIACSITQYILVRETESDPESALMATLSTNASEAQSYYSSKYEELHLDNKCNLVLTIK